MSGTAFTLVWLFYGPVLFGHPEIQKDQQINFGNRLTFNDCVNMADDMNNALQISNGKGLSYSRVICVPVPR